MNFKNYFTELKRRNVFKAAIAYLVVAWLVIQVLSIILPTFNAPSFVLKISIITLAIGFPIWVGFSWVYDLTSQGLQKTDEIRNDSNISTNTGNKLTTITIIALSIIVIILFVTNISSKSYTKDIVTPISSTQDTRTSIAILPFKNLNNNEENLYFTEGMHEDVLNKLAGLKNLRIIARTSVMKFKNFEGNLDSLGKVLNTEYFVEGTVRKYENQIRVTINLIKAASNETLWSNNYDKKLANVFIIQNENGQKGISSKAIVICSWSYYFTSTIKFYFS